MVSFSRAASCASHFPRLKSSTTLETSCFGVWRSDTFSVLDSRSRSRCRIRSRSLATAFMRFCRPSPANNGMISVYAVAPTAMAASSIVMKCASWILSTRNSTMLHHQKSKLIILFITKMPMDIQITQPTSINWPVGWVHSSEMYSGVER